MIFSGNVLGGKLMESIKENCHLTLNTTRICENNPIDISIAISEIAFANMKPNAVILIEEEDIFNSIAATPLVHLPINAAILFTDGRNLRGKTLKTIERLSPKGYKGIHAFLVGNISRQVSLELNNHGYKTEHIKGSNHYETACMIPSMREDFKNILIMSGEDCTEGISATYWSAHHGDPILYVKHNSIPYCTIEAIRKNKDINVYIIGSTKTVSKAVEKYLSRLENVKHLDRIDGDDSYDISVNFAKYKSPKNQFGWDRNDKEGHAFTFGELNHPMETIAGTLFAHMGKHTPLLLIRQDSVPEVVENYIESVKPTQKKNMPGPPFMHGFIIGDSQIIDHKAQLMVEESLSIDHEMMEISRNRCKSETVRDNLTDRVDANHYRYHMFQQEDDYREFNNHNDMIIGNHSYKRLNVDYNEVGINELLG